MTAVYPHQVDVGNPTIGGLPSYSQFVNTPSMAKNPDPTPFIEIGSRLAAIRKAESELSQKDWAARHSFGPTQYNNWENGVRRITVDEAERLCSIYGLSLDFIYRGNLSGVPESIKKLL